jgi:hypothetical protein
MDPPFQHKIAEPWDPKYCNAPDKMGVDTKERYENIIRSDNYKVTFDQYFFYFNAFDPNDRNNPRETKILPNNHHKLQNGLSNQHYINNSTSRRGNDNEEKILYNNQNFNREQGITNNRSSIDMGNLGKNQPSFVVKNNMKQGMMPHSSSQNNLMFKKIDGSSSSSNNYNNYGNSNNMMQNNNDLKIMTNIDSKFSKIKQMSNSGSASSLLRQYRVSGISSSYGGVNNQNQVNNFSSVISNQHNKKSQVGSFNSSNSTNTSNPNSNIISSNSSSYNNHKDSNNQYGNQNFMRKSGSSSYLGK